MSKSYSSFVSKKVKLNVPAPVSAPLPGRDEAMTPNSDGAFVFKLDKWSQLDRFLILGAATPTYYASRNSLVKDSVGVIEQCIKENGHRVVNRLVEISKAGRAPKNDPALFTLALVATRSQDTAVRLAAWKSVPEVARIGTHLFHYVQYVDELGGWGKGNKKSVANWFTSRPAEKLAYQAIKYKQRDGWSMRDVLRTVHPKTQDAQQSAIFHWITKGWDNVGEMPHPDPALRIIWAAERAKGTTSAAEIAKLVSDYGLPWEAIDTKWLNSEVVWDALLDHIKPEALMRNLSRLTANGFIKPLGSFQKRIVSKLTDAEAIVANRLHPLKVLVALRTYQKGQGEKGSLTWTPDQGIVAALEVAYYAAFKSVVPANKRTLLALDMSASMTWASCAGMPITPREASAAMAMVTARTEPAYHFVGFSSQIMPLAINHQMSLADVVNYIESRNAAGTDISAPFKWAMKNKIEVDTFVCLTDNETNLGEHPSKVLREYRQKMGIPAKLVVVGMVTNGFTVADPDDGGMLDVVGFDTASPQLISDFSAGRI